MENEANKEYELNEIRELLSDLYGYEFKGLNSDLISFLKSKNYNRKCSVDNLQCSFCIYSWLYCEKKKQLYYSHIPFSNYESRLNFYRKNKKYFDLTITYVFNDEDSFSLIPKSEEEAKLYTVELKKYFRESTERDRYYGKTELFGIPLKTYEEFKSDFEKIYKKSPHPKQYLINERKRINELISKSSTTEEDVLKTYNSIISCEEIIYEIESKDDQHMKFYSYNLTYPIAKYKIFLEKFTENKIMMNGKNKINVLVAFANPRGTSQLNLGKEDKVIKEAIKLSRDRDNIDLDICHATTIHDLRRALLDKDYQIVHISGHGTGSGLVLEDETGGKYVVPQQALAEVFEAYSFPNNGKLECVILNACYSINQGGLISLGVPFTVGMEGAISDSAAIEFSRGFYDAIGAQKTFDFAYGEGCRTVKLVTPNTKFVSKLLKKGKNYSGEAMDNEVTEYSDSVIRSEEVVQKVENSLIGIAIDVSGSMKNNIKNNTNNQLTRLESFNQSLKKLTQEAQKTIRENKERKIETSIELFAYAFGLRDGSVCDLLSLLKIGTDIISKEEIEQMKKRFTREMKSKYSSYGGLGNLARDFGLGSLAGSVERVARASAENEIRKRIMLEIRDRLQRSLNAVGDTTLPIEKVAEMTDDSKETMNNAEEFIFGNTPMREAFTKIQRRFSQECEKRPEDTVPILFVISDGEPTDGNPNEIANQMKKSGVTVITCYVTNKDIANPHVLYGQSQNSWDNGANLMFNMSSEIEENSSFAKFLLKKGWKIQENSKLFVQINHSSVMEEFINVVLSPFEERRLSSLPMGT